MHDDTATDDLYGHGIQQGIPEGRTMDGACAVLESLKGMPTAAGISGSASGDACAARAPVSIPPLGNRPPGGPQENSPRQFSRGTLTAGRAPNVISGSVEGTGGDACVAAPPSELDADILNGLEEALEVDRVEAQAGDGACAVAGPAAKAVHVANGACAVGPVRSTSLGPRRTSLSPYGGRNTGAQQGSISGESFVNLSTPSSQDASMQAGLVAQNAAVPKADEEAILRAQLQAADAAQAAAAANQSAVAAQELAEQWRMRAMTVESSAHGTVAALQNQVSSHAHDSSVLQRMLQSTVLELQATQNSHAALTNSSALQGGQLVELQRQLVEGESQRAQQSQREREYVMALETEFGAR